MRSLALAAAFAAAAAPALAGPCNTAGMRSPGTSAPTQFTIVNAVPDRTASLFWIDFNGNPVLYATIPPGGSHTQQTYRGHIWISENSFGYCDLIFIPENNIEVIVR